jgi:signal transduction histidine kinase/ActR/RegA family two-component response regulator
LNNFSSKALEFIDRFVPYSQRTKNDEIRRSTRVVYVFLFLAISFSLILGSLRIYRGDALIGWTTLCFAILGLLTPVIHQKWGSLKLAALWLIGLLTVLLTGMAVVAGGLYSTASLWYGPVLVFILVTIGYRSALVWVLGIALHSFLLFWLPRHGIVLPDFQNHAVRDITMMIAIPASLIVTVTMLYGFFQAHRHAIESLDLQARTLFQQATELREAKEQAEAAMRARGEFIAIVSHEIRTPMNGILGVAQLLNGTPLNASQITYLQALNQSAEGLLAILNDILDFSKIEAGKMEIQVQTFALRALCNETIGLFNAIAKIKGIRLSLEIQPSLTDFFLGDPVRISQVLNNLVGNAIKFTEVGDVTLTVSKHESETDELNFSIQDSGIGMSESTLAKLFKPYTQADSSFSRKFGGTGLGLAICQRLTEMMGGKISAESTLDQGSRFSIQLPLPEANPDFSVTARNVDDAEGALQFIGANRKILLVEDNTVNRMVAVKMLEKFGVQIEVAKDGQEAVEKWKAGHFDLIFMDCQMPEMDGYEATRTIRIYERERDPNERIPIIALTAHAMEEDQQRCMDAGMDAYLTKPVKAQVLKKSLETWLK